MKIHSEVDTNSCEGLTRLLRFAIAMRNRGDDQAALQRLEKRFGIVGYEPQFRGALEDFCRHLEGLGPKQRFATIYTLISDVLDGDAKLDGDVVEELLDISALEKIVRFSFAPSFLHCLLHAQKKPTPRRGYAGYETRYAGVGEDRELMAFASLYLELGIYTETNPPWDPDLVYEENEPNSELPDLEISFPPAEFRSEIAPNFEASVRASKLPRAVDRGKYDLESVMLGYLCETNARALVFTSESFLSSTKQSRLLVRQRLLEALRVRKVSEIEMAQSPCFLIELGPMHHENGWIQLSLVRTVLLRSREPAKQVRSDRRDVFISVADIQSEGWTLKPSRYLMTGPTDGGRFNDWNRRSLYPTKHRLVDFFEITRPKTTRDDPVGTFAIKELRAGNISANGEISGALRKINVRSTLERGLEEQMVKPGDILFAHRGPIGNAAYVTEADIQEDPMWAGQTLLIFREKKKKSGDRVTGYCDPRVLLMYLLTPAVRASWSKFSTEDRSPAIPIGQIESLALPANLILDKKPKQVADHLSSASSGGYADRILTEFHSRQKNLLALSEVQASINLGLGRVWDLAWPTQNDSDKA